MQDREKPPLGIRIFTPIFFILSSLAALYWFFFRTFEIFINPLSPVEVFDKGSFYMLGVGIGLLILAIVTVQEGWLNKKLSKKQSSFLTKVAILSVVLIFLTPQLMHYCANKYLARKGYTVCDEASHQWLFVRDIVYLEPSVDCTKDIVKAQ
ncbi:hypothetical protein MAH1_14110 [Sessilibacter sp. MAH1]